MLIVHFLGLAMGLGTSIAMMIFGIATAKMDPEEAKTFMRKAVVLAYMGKTGLALLILSGGYLMTPYWGSLMDAPMLVAKLSLVVILTVLISMISVYLKQIKRGNDAAMLKMKKMGQLALPVTLAILVLAVLVFK